MQLRQTVVVVPLVPDQHFLAMLSDSNDVKPFSSELQSGDDVRRIKSAVFQQTSAENTRYLHYTVH